MGTAPPPVAALRGAEVGPVDARRVAGVVTGLCLAGLLAAAVVLLVAGVHKNSQITALHQRGVVATMRVTGCRGNIGGSGSNGAGYTCEGVLRLGGRSYRENIPGDVSRPTGQTLSVVAVPGDPALLVPASTLVDQHTSAGVYVLPAVLLGLFLTGGAGALWRWRRPVQPGQEG